MSETLPLSGRRVVVTRPRLQSSLLVERLEALGATPIEFPVMRIRPLGPSPAFDEALRFVERYAWVVFTSVNGVEIVWDRLAELGLGAEALRARPVAAIGPATAEALRERGVDPAFVPQVFVGERLGEGLPVAAGERVLLARAEGSRPALPEILARRGAVVEEFPIYAAVAERPEPMAYEQLRRGCEAVTFTSPSTVRHFVGALEASGLEPNGLPGRPVIACIGPITARAAEEAGLPADLVAGSYTTAGLVDALLEHFQREVAR